MRIDHIQLAIPAVGEDRARRFYCDLLGFTEVPKPPELAKRGGLWFRCGEVALHLGVDADFRPAKKAHPAFRCDDYDALLERLHASGIAVQRDNATVDGSEHCYVSDPFGNRIELIAA